MELCNSSYEILLITGLIIWICMTSRHISSQAIYTTSSTWSNKAMSRFLSIRQKFFFHFYSVYFSTLANYAYQNVFEQPSLVIKKMD